MTTKTREFVLVLKEIEADNERAARAKARRVVLKYFEGAKVRIKRCKPRKGGAT